MIERQCNACGWVYGIHYDADPRSFICRHCQPKSPNRAMRSLMRVKARLYVGN